MGEKAGDYSTATRGPSAGSVEVCSGHALRRVAEWQVIRRGQAALSLDSPRQLAADGGAAPSPQIILDQGELKATEVGLDERLDFRSVPIGFSVVGHDAAGHVGEPIDGDFFVGEDPTLAPVFAGETGHMVNTLVSFVRRPQLGKQRLHHTAQFRQVAGCIEPDESRCYVVIAMGQVVPEIDDAAHVGNLTGKARMIGLQAVYRLADDLELAFDRGLRSRIGSVGSAVHAVDEQLDISACLVNIRQQDAGVTTHRQVRDIR